MKKKEEDSISIEQQIEQQIIEEMEQVKIISALEFAETNGFSERDRNVVDKMFPKSILKTKQEWNSIFKKKFNFKSK